MGRRPGEWRRSRCVNASVCRPRTHVYFSTAPVDPPPANGTVVRKKSIRVSLQPTFSPSPPALYDDDGDAPGEDVWADSTSEEEVYRRARGLLSIVGKDKNKSDGKGKGRR